MTLQDMIESSFETLRRLGLTPAMARRLASAEVSRPAPPSRPAPKWLRLIASHRETVDVHDGSQSLSARCLPQLNRELIEHASNLVVGDWVLCDWEKQRQLWVLARATPMNQIVRRDANGSRSSIVSNVDTALLVMGLDLDFNLRRLERYLALLGSSKVLPVVVLTKADIAQQTGPHHVQQRIDEVRARVGSQLDVLALDARSAEASTRLAPYLGLGQTLVLLGSSGAGKSTLTNGLLGRAKQDTGPVREHDSRGKHTTTARSLHLLPSGACLIDTPGVRTLRPDVDADTLGQLFEDISALAPACRFRDCSHHDEPGCAVRAQVSAERLKNYHKLLRESRREIMGAQERQRQMAEWKARGRASRQRLEMKRQGR